MASQLLMPAATPSTATATAATTITTAAAANNTTSRTSTSPASTIFSLTEDDLREIFLRLPDLPSLVRAALTCRPWLSAVRSSRPFRRLFRALHPAPLIGLFLKIGSGSAPSFLPLCRSDPVVNAALRRGDFFLTSLPPSPKGWSLADCRDGYVLLWNGSQDRPRVRRRPQPHHLGRRRPPAGARRDGVREPPRRLRPRLPPGLLRREPLVVPRDLRLHGPPQGARRRLLVGHVGVGHGAVGARASADTAACLKFMAGTLVGGSVFWPYHGEARMVRIHTATMDVSFVDLPPGVHKSGHNIGIGETKSGELCIVYASDFTLHVWIRRPSVDGTEIWAPPTLLQLDEHIDQLTHASVLDMQLHLKIVQVSPGLVHFSATCTTHIGTLHCWFFSLSLETMVLDLLLQGSFDGVAHLYNMGWPPCLVGDGENIGHE